MKETKEKKPDVPLVIVCVSSNEELVFAEEKDGMYLYRYVRSSTKLGLILPFRTVKELFEFLTLQGRLKGTALDNTIDKVKVKQQEWVL